MNESAEKIAENSEFKDNLHSNANHNFEPSAGSDVPNNNKNDKEVVSILQLEDEINVIGRQS